MVCAGSLIWSISGFGDTLYRTALDESTGGISWIIPGENSPQENSVLPQLVNPVYYGLLVKDAFGNFSKMVWRPAFYLYISMWIVAVFSLRTRNVNALIIGSPIIIQSALMFLINISQDMRYQYGVMLIGLFTIIFLFWPQNSRIGQEDE